MVKAGNAVPPTAHADVESLTKFCTLKIRLFLVPAVGRFLFWDRRVSLDQRTDA